MCDPALWALMQRVERLRFRAELLERASIDQPRAVRRMLLQLAAHSRDMAERAYTAGFAPTQTADTDPQPGQQTPSALVDAHL
jgi:hypothetical protein